MKTGKKVIAFLMAVVFMVGLMPGITPAETVIDNRPDMPDVLSLAKEALGADGESTDGSWRYVVLKDYGWAVVTGYNGETASDMMVPDLLGGYDTVGIAENALYDLKGITSVQVPGNVSGIGQKAFPKGTTVKALNASPAQKWASQNRYAFQNTSELQFIDGVADLSDTRVENFVRVSETEVWLRELESRRLSPGMVFFLPDPSNLYQISYYRVLSMSEPRDGFVTVLCETPDVDDVIYYIEGTNELMMLDPDSITLFDGVELTESDSFRKITGKKEESFGIGINFGWELSPGLKFEVKDMGYRSEYEATYRGGLWTKNKAEIKETTEWLGTISFSAENGNKNKEKISQDKKNLLKLLENKERISKERYNQKKEVPLFTGVVVSIFGIVFLNVTVRFRVEISGSISVTFSSKTVKTTTIEEGSDTRTESKEVSKSITGEAKGECKIGVVAAFELYFFATKLASVKFFIGLKGTASFAEEYAEQGIIDGVSQLWIINCMDRIESPIVLHKDININMIDCVEIRIGLVCEVSFNAGLDFDTDPTDFSVDFYKKSLTIFDIELVTFHIHLSLFEYEPEPYTDGWEQKETYEYTLGRSKNNIHLKSNCPYDYKIVKVILPYDNDKVFAYDNKFENGGIFYEPVVEDEYSRKLGYKITGWHIDKEHPKASKVTFWPVEIKEDTTFYADSEKMHKIELIRANGSKMKGDNTIVTDSLFPVSDKTLSDAYYYVPNDGFIIFPSTTNTGNEILYWIRVASSKNLKPIDYSDENEDWKIQPETLYKITADMEEDLIFCAVTASDVAVYLHSCIQGITDIIYGTRGISITLPSCDLDLPRMVFAGWMDIDGNIIDNTITIDINSESSIHFYAKWDISNEVTAVDVNDPHIGSHEPGYQGNIPADPVNDFSYYLSSEGIVITGYHGDTEDLLVPGTITVDEIEYIVTKISPEAFKNNEVLRTVVLPNTITEIGYRAFSNCENLVAIDISAANVSAIPESFARECKNLQCVRIGKEQIESVGSNAFYGCETIDSIRLNADIESSAFSGCTGITAVVLGAGVKSIGAYAFSDCTGISVLEVPDSVESLGNGFISGCTGITELILKPALDTLTAAQMTIGENSALNKLTIGGKVTVLGNEAFANGTYGFTELKTVEIKQVIWNLGNNVLRGSSIEELTVSLPVSLDINGNVFSGMTHLRKVTIESGRIGENMFQDNTNLEEVVIGAGVISIGKSAFSGCSKLRAVSFTDPSLSRIGTGAFANCTSLESFKIPDSVTSYGAGMFMGCTGLKSLEVGGGVAELSGGYSSFNTLFNPFYIGENSSLETLVLGEGITSIGPYTFANGIMGSSSGTLGFSKLTNLELPSTLESLGSQAFYGSAITEVTLGKGVAASDNLFKDLDKLKKVTVLGGDIGDYAFSGCIGLETIILEEGVTSIGRFAFNGCIALTSLTIPDSVTAYGEGVISGCTNLSYLKVGGGVTDLSAGSTNYEYLLNPFYIGPDNSLETLVLGEGIRSIGSYTFGNAYNESSSHKHGFSHLTTLELPSSLESIGSQAFYGSAITEIDLADGLAASDGVFRGFVTLKKVTIRGGSIGDYAFTDCIGLETIILEEGVTSIGRFAFSGCTALTTLTFPDSVTGYGEGMISGCTNISYLKVGGGVTDLSAGSTNYEYLLNPFYIGPNNSLKTLVLGEGIRSIGGYTFGNAYNESSSRKYGFSQLTTLELPSSLESIGNQAFYGSAITEIDLADGLAASDGVFRGFVTLKKVTVRGGSIGNYAFSECTGLETIILEEGVTSIGRNAFSGCTALTSLTIPDSVTAYGEGMISGCTNISYLKVGGGVTDLSAGSTNYEYLLNPFYIGPDNSLETLVLGEGITSIGNYTFGNVYNTSSSHKHGFDKLTRVELPSTLKTLGYQVFYGSAITELDLADGLAASDGAFRNFVTLKKVTIRGGDIGNEAFAGCTGLNTVILKEGVTSIGRGAFSGCIALKSLTIPDSVIAYGADMISGCKNLTYLKVGGGVAELIAGSSSYASDRLNPFYIGPENSLETLVLGEGITYIGAYTFGNTTQASASNVYGFSKLTKVSLPSTLRSIGSNNLSRWGKVTSLLLPSGLTSISDGSFTGMTLYSKVYNNVIDSFANSKGLTYIYDDESLLPFYKLVCVIQSAFTNSRGLTVSDGTMMVTRGTDGEETELPEGFVVLSTDEVLFTDEVIVDDPPVMEGCKFYGWYTDPEFLEPWNMTTMPSADITLYARIEPLIRVRYAVNLASAGTADSSLPWGFVLYKEYYVEEYSELPVPADPPVNNYALTGWYMDAGFVQDYLPAKVKAADITIYGNLKRASSGASYKLVNGTYTLVKYTSEQDEDPVVYIPSTYNGRAVTAIGADAFMGSSATEVHLPGSITRVDQNAFDYSSVIQIYVNRSNEAFSSSNGALYNKDKSELIMYSSSRRSGNFVIPDTVIRIADNAFKGNRYLTTVDFSDNLQEIGADAFNGCTSLSTVILPDTCSVIRVGAFENCYNIQRFEAYGITEIEQGDGETLPKMIAAVYGPVGTGVLRDWFVYTENGKTYTFNYNHYNAELYIDGELHKTISAEAGFPLSSNILFEEDEESNIMISSWYKDASFSEIWDIDNDIMPEEAVKLYTSTSPVYTYETVTLDIDGTSVTGITLTGYNGTAKNLVIPASIEGQPVVAISESFLSTSCTVQNLTIGSHVLHIDENAMAAFNGTLYCEAGSAAQEWAAGHSITVVIKQYTITFVVDNATVAPVQAETGVYLRLPVPVLGSMTFLGWFTDEECSIPVTLDEDGFYIMGSGDVTLYGAWAEIEEIDFKYEIEDGNITITGYTGDEDAVIIPDTIIGLPVTRIADAAFAYNNYVGTVTVPDTVVEIGVSAFADCRYLSAVNLGNGITEIDNSWFYGCGRLRDINISVSNTDLCSVDGVVFNKAQTMIVAYPAGRSDTSYEIPEGITAIGDGAFESQRYLESVTIPDTVTAIGDGAFMGCAVLSGIEASSVISIGDNAFMGCYGLESADFGENLETIGSFAFMGCESLVSIYLPAGTSLDTDALYFSSSDLVITGHLGSSAYDYAAAHNIMFIDPDATCVTEVTLNETGVVLKRGDQLQLEASVLPADADFGTDITWYSSDSSVVVVDEDGLVAAIGGGTAEITAVAGNGVSASCAVEVYISTTGVNVTGAYDRLWLIDEARYLQLYAEVQPYNASFQDIIWSSSNESIATVNGDGLVTAVAPGTATIYAMTTDPNGITGEFVITVNSGDLSTMTMPSALTSIEDEAFLNDDSVQYVILGSAVAAIGANAFADMDSLELILIPASVIDIADTAFAGSYPVIICTEGSYAESFAIANGMEYISIQ